MKFRHFGAFVGFEPVEMHGRARTSVVRFNQFNSETEIENVDQVYKNEYDPCLMIDE